MKKTNETNILQISDYGYGIGLGVTKCLDKTIETIEIPEGVEFIGEKAFAFCKNLKSITFPHSLRSIDPYAFFRCTNLENLDFSKSKLTGRIHSKAFFECSKLSDISSLPQDKIFISNDAFEGCPILNFNHPSIQIKNGLVVIGNCIVGCTKIESCLEVKVPQGVDTIQSGAFSNEDISELHIGEGIKVIKTNAIICESLLLLTLPTSLEKISENAFGEEGPIFTIENRSNVKGFEWLKQLKNDNDKDIKYCVRDGRFVIGIRKDKTTLVSARPDYDNFEIVVPDDITYIEYDAFYYCEHHYITIPESFVLKELNVKDKEQECICGGICGENKFLLPKGAKINRYFKAE